MRTSQTSLEAENSFAGMVAAFSIVEPSGNFRLTVTLGVSGKSWLTKGLVIINIAKVDPSTSASMYHHSKVPGLPSLCAPSSHDAIRSRSTPSLWKSSGDWPTRAGRADIFVAIIVTFRCGYRGAVVWPTSPSGLCAVRLGARASEVGVL